MAKDREDDPREPPVDPERWDAIHRFLDGLSPLPERVQVEEWIARDLTLQRYVKAHQKVWSMIARRVGPTAIDPDQAWETVQDDIAEHERRQRFGLPGRGREHLRVIEGDLGLPRTARRLMVRRTFAIGVGTAAAILIGVMSVVTLRRVVQRIGTEHQQVAPPLVSYFAIRGAPPRQLRLPDGIAVTLAPESHLEYAVDRNGAHIASLLGRAFFTVDHRPDRIFIVRAAGFEARDLGTEFDVRAYPGSVPRVAVLQGSVSVRTRRSVSTIDAGLVAAIDSAGGSNLAAADASYFEWTTGRLAFAHQQLGDVVADIGRKYDLDFDIPDANLSALPVTVTVFRDTPAQFLEQLSRVIPGLGYEQHGRTVHLFRR